MSALSETLRNLGPARLVVVAGLGIGLVAFFFFLFTRLTEPDMTLLYGDLDLNDSSRIVAKLDSLTVPYKIRANGTQILVPRDQVARLRMSMAEEGLPNGGSVGYELFDKSDTLGTTNFVQKINQLRALEGELARTIRSLSNVESARVHLVLPQRRLFSREKENPSASIVLKLRGNRFSPSQVFAVQQLVASAVPGLSPERVSVIDSNGTLLARATEPGKDGLAALNADEKRQAFQTRLARTIEELLERSVGVGKVRAEVTADMDFDRITTNSETYDPDGQVVRSTQSVEESATSKENKGEDAVSVETNLPQTEPSPAAGGPKSATKSARTEETVNYEISRTVRNQVRESGIVRRISAAVLVDGSYTTAKDGTKTYVPRTNEEMQQFEKLVRSAIGFSAKRGDTVELVNMPFVTAGNDWTEDPTPPLFGLTKADYFRGAEILVLGIVAMLVILLVVRPLMARIFEALPAPGTRSGGALLADQSDGAPPALAAPASAVAETNRPPGAAQSEIDSMIDLDQVDGRVKTSSIKKVGEIIEKHPEETVSIIRNWMFQENQG